MRELRECTVALTHAWVRVRDFEAEETSGFLKSLKLSCIHNEKLHRFAVVREETKTTNG